MAASLLDDFLLRHAPRLPQPVTPALLGARLALERALADLGTVRDEALERPWPWRGEQAGVRYGFYRQLEALEEARARLRPMLASAAGNQPPARPLIAAATAARWELHGLLLGLADAELDADPGGEEWTLRRTLAHVVSSQRAYGWFTSWWLAQRELAADGFPSQVPDELADLLPDEDLEGAGSLADIRRRLDDILDLSAGALAGLQEDDLQQPARWSGIPVTVGFRLGRWSSHLHEHTIQLEKTLVMIGRPLSEVERLVRLIATAYGRLEEELYFWPPAVAAASEAAGRVTDRLEDVAAEATGVRAATR